MWKGTTALAEINGSSACAGVTEAVKREFVTFELKAGGDHAVQASSTPGHIEHAITTLAVEVVVMGVCNGGWFVPIRLPGHGDGFDRLVFKQSLDDSIDGAEADAGRTAFGDLSDFPDRQGSSGILDRRSNCSLL